MKGWAALLRAVNVGGTGKLPMAELKAMCEGLGLERVQTYIASGNVVFASALGEAQLRGAIETALEARYGKPFGVMVRSAAELGKAVANNPWPDRPSNRVVAIFIDGPLSLGGITGQRGETIALGCRHIYVDYHDGMADTRLRIPAAKLSTARNMNTVAKLAAMAGALPRSSPFLPNGTNGEVAAASAADGGAARPSPIPLRHAFGAPPPLLASQNGEDLESAAAA